jgi:hypothetical protein
LPPDCVVLPELFEPLGAGGGDGGGGKGAARTVIVKFAAAEFPVASRAVQTTFVEEPTVKGEPGPGLQTTTGLGSEASVAVGTA